MNIKEIWAKNPVFILVFVAFGLALVLLIWNYIVKVFSYLRSSLKGVGSSLSSDEAKAIAKAVFDEVNSMFTNETVIVNKIKVLSLADYYKVQAAFGIVPYSNTFDNFDTLTGVDSNLTEVLNQTLSNSDKDKIKEQNASLPIS